MAGFRLAAGAAFVAGLVVAGGPSASARPPAPPSRFHVRPAVSGAPAPGARDEGPYLEAVASIARRDYPAAIDRLEAAMARAGETARVLNAFAVVYDKMGRFDLSARYYSRARDLDPDSTIVARNQAYSRILQGHAAPSTESIEKPLASERRPSERPS